MSWSIGERPSYGPGQEVGKFLAPHGVCMDARGDIYVGEVSYTNYRNINAGKEPPANMRSLQKLERVT